MATAGWAWAPWARVVEVGPGECLYLPALWFHYVTQRRGPGRASTLHLTIGRFRYIASRAER